jgi:hypothetical protein
MPALPCSLALVVEVFVLPARQFEPCLRAREIPLGSFDCEQCLRFGWR